MNASALDRRTKKYQANIENIRNILEKEEKKLEKHILFTNIFKMYQDDENFTPLSSIDTDYSRTSMDCGGWEEEEEEEDEEELVISMDGDEEEEDEDDDEETGEDEIQSLIQITESENKPFLKKCISVAPKLVEVVVVTGCFC